MSLVSRAGSAASRTLGALRPAARAECAECAEPGPQDAAAPAGGEGLPGSAGEHLLQERVGSQDRARRFYDDQVLDHLNPAMREFVERQEMAFIATADAGGECDSSFRAGPPGFMRVLDSHTVAYPEYRGNGVMASCGNILENRHIGILLVDFFSDLIGLHINGTAQLVGDEEMRRGHAVPEPDIPGRRPERWVVVSVTEAYIHCSKHLPRLARTSGERAWGTDDFKRKGGDFFGARASARKAP